jgi:hypothetical protein
MTASTCESQPTRGGWDLNKVHESIDNCFNESKPHVITAAHAISGPAAALLVNQAIELAKTTLEASDPEKAAVINPLLEIAKGPIVTSVQHVAPKVAEVSVNTLMPMSQTGAHKSVDAVERSMTSISF